MLKKQFTGLGASSLSLSKCAGLIVIPPGFYTFEGFAKKFPGVRLPFSDDEIAEAKRMGSTGMIIK